MWDIWSNERHPVATKHVHSVLVSFATSSFLVLL